MCWDTKTFKQSTTLNDLNFWIWYYNNEPFDWLDMYSSDMKLLKNQPRFQKTKAAISAFSLQRNYLNLIPQA